MKKPYLMGNIKPTESVNITEDDMEEAERIEGNPDLMLRLVDLIFGFEPDKLPPS